MDTLQDQAHRERSVNDFKVTAEAPAFSNLTKPWYMNGLEFHTVLY